MLPPLLAALAGDLGDPSLVPDHLRPDLSVFMDPTFGLSAAQVDEGNALAVGGAAAAARRGPRSPCGRSRSTSCAPLLAFVTGGAASDDYLELLRDELALGEDLRTPHVAQGGARRPIARSASRSSAPGMSGLVAAHRLHQAGVEVVVLEKNDDVGGTWLENSYPGLPGRRVQPLLLLLLRAAGRLAAALLHPGGAARLLPGRGRDRTGCGR